MREKFKKLFKDQQGYGTVELLIIIAALGVVASKLMKGFETTMVGKEGSTDPTIVGTVGEKIKNMVNSWDTPSR